MHYRKIFFGFFRFSFVKDDEKDEKNEKSGGQNSHNDVISNIFDIAHLVESFFFL